MLPEVSDLAAENDPGERGADHVRADDDPIALDDAVDDPKRQAG